MYTVINNYLVSGCDTATHFAAQLVEYVALNAHCLEYDTLVTKIRAIALAWGRGTKGYDEAIMVLNMIKEEAWNYTLTPTRAWLLVKSVFHSGKHLTREIIAFMDNLEMNGVIHYTIFIKKDEKQAELLEG